MFIPRTKAVRASKPSTNSARHAVITQSALMRRLIDDASRMALSSATVMLTGESGTGKELFARIIHEGSLRRDKPFVRVNCAALPDNLIESELFGHERGSFTDAVSQRIGRFEFAQGGTLLLDEVTEIPMSTQSKLLRALEENEIQRVGSNESLETDVRVVATSNRNVLREVEAGRFRLDLYHRLNVIEIKIPPLRERAMDIPLLAMHFLHMFKHENDVDIQGFSASAMQQMKNHAWPGNIRELRNAIHRACVMSRRPQIDEQCLSVLNEAVASPATPQGVPDEWLYMRLAEIEKQIIMASISKFGSKRAAAESLGVTARTLTNKLKLYSTQPAGHLNAA